MQTKKAAAWLKTHAAAIDSLVALEPESRHDAVRAILGACHLSSEAVFKKSMATMWQHKKSKRRVTIEKLSETAYPSGASLIAVYRGDGLLIEKMTVQAFFEEYEACA